MLTNEQVRAVLDEIAARNGGVLLAEHVLRDAQDARHPLHDRFEWRDDVAAHRHRLDQARGLIRSVRVEVSVEERTVSAVYFVEHPGKRAGDPGYIALPKVQTDQEMAQALVAQELARAAASLERALEISAALGVRDSLTDVLARLRALSGAMPTKNAA